MSKDQKMERHAFEKLGRDLKSHHSKEEKYEFLERVGLCGMDGEQVRSIVSGNFTEYERPKAIHALAKAHAFTLRGGTHIGHIICLCHMHKEKLEMLEHCVHHGRIEKASDDTTIRDAKKWIGGVEDGKRVTNIMKGKNREDGLEPKKKETVKEKVKPKAEEPEKPKEPSPWDKLSEADKIYAMDQYKKTGKIPIETICKMRNCTPEEAARIQDAESEAFRKGEEMAEQIMKGGGLGAMMGGMGGAMSGMEVMGGGMPGMGGAMGGMPGMGGAMGGMPGMGGTMGGMPGMGGAMGGMPGMGGAMGGMPGMGGGMPAMSGMQEMGGGMAETEPSQQQQVQGQQQQFQGMNTGGFPGF